MKSMTAFGNDVGFFAGETEAKTEGFEADGALVLDVFQMVVGDDGDGRNGHGSKGMGRMAGSAGSGGGGGGGADRGGFAVCAFAKDGVEGLERRLGEGRSGCGAGRSEGGGERRVKGGICWEVMQDC